jgi:hypothetical protein
LKQALFPSKATVEGVIFLSAAAAGVDGSSSLFKPLCNVLPKVRIRFKISRKKIPVRTGNRAFL